MIHRRYLLLRGFRVTHHGGKFEPDVYSDPGTPQVLLSEESGKWVLPNKLYNLDKDPETRITYIGTAHRESPNPPWGNGGSDLLDVFHAEISYAPRELCWRPLRDINTHYQDPFTPLVLHLNIHKIYLLVVSEDRYVLVRKNCGQICSVDELLPGVDPLPYAEHTVREAINPRSYLLQRLDDLNIEFRCMTVVDGFIEHIRGSCQWVKISGISSLDYFPFLGSFPPRASDPKYAIRNLGNMVLGLLRSPDLKPCHPPVAGKSLFDFIL